MRILAVGFALSACLGWGQASDARERVFYLTHTDTVQQFQEVATVIRTIADIQQVSADNEQKSLTVHATAGQIAMAEWLFNELDNPSVQPSVLHEYRVPGSSDDVVRLFYLTRTPTVQDFQEVATVVRTIANFRRAFTYNEARAYVVRGTASQMGLAEWILKELEPTAAPAAHQYRMPGADDDVVGVMYLAHTPSVQSFQRAATRIRETTRIQRMFTYNSPRAVTVRGTADQIATAERLATQLDRP
jgi:hypothetical protein